MTHRSILAIVATIPLFTACKNDSTSKEGAKPVEAVAKPEVPIDLTDTLDVGAAITDPDQKAFVGLKVEAPAGAKVESGLTGVLIKTGENGYELSKAYDPGYVAKVKGEAQTDSLDKVVKFHVDSPDAILWETKSELGGTNNFHFAAEVAVGEDKYKCGNTGYGHFTRSEADALLKSCQSAAR